MTCIGICNMRPILNACSFLAGRLEEEAVRPAMHQDPARCTAHAELQLQNMADQRQHNSTEADYATSLGGREGSLSPKQALNQLAEETRLRLLSSTTALGFCRCRTAGPSRLRRPRSYEILFTFEAF